jgi:hypothetical protein
VTLSENEIAGFQHSHAELRAAVMLAGTEIRKLNLGRADTAVVCPAAARPAGGPRCAKDGIITLIRLELKKHE